MDNTTVREFHRPADEAAALDLLSRKSPATAPVWIGPRVPDILHEGIEAAVDLSRLGLSYIRQDSDRIRIGALTPLQALADSELLRGLAGGIVAEAARLSAGSALRQAATIGGALSLRGPDRLGGRGDPPELALVLLALDASLIYIDADGNRTTIAVETTHGAPMIGGGLLVEVMFARVTEGEMGAIMRIARTPRDQAIVAAVAIANSLGGVISRLRLAVSGAGEWPVRLPAVEQALAGQAPTPDRLDAVEAQVGALVDPRTDYLGSAGYRREMAGLLIRRAIEVAVMRGA